MFTAGNTEESGLKHRLAKGETLLITAILWIDIFVVLYIMKECEGCSILVPLICQIHPIVCADYRAGGGICTATSSPPEWTSTSAKSQSGGEWQGRASNDQRRRPL